MPTLDIKQNILQENAKAAESLRKQFATNKTLVLNFISSPGSGKTSLLEATIARLKDKYRLAAIDGDIATERDADRLRALGISAEQISTGGACHLDARQISTALKKGNFGKLDILFIENVGNLICPTSYDLGEDGKIVLLSVTEGDDKPFKYPGIFSKADTAVITKIDLLPHVRFDESAVNEQITTLRPNGTIHRLSVTTGEGVEGWIKFITQRFQNKQTRA